MAEEDEPNDESRSITLGLIVAYLFGVFFVFVGLVMTIAGPIGVPIFLAGLFLLPPVRRRIQNYADVEFSRGAVTGIVIGFVVLAAVVGGTGGGGDGGSTTDTPTSTAVATTEAASADQDQSTPTPTPTATATSTPSNEHELGETFTVGSGDQQIEYTVLKVETLNAVVTSYSTTEANGVFVAVRVDLKNVGSQSIDLTSGVFKMVSSDGDTYTTDNEAMTYFDSDARFDGSTLSYEQLHPDLSTTGWVVFDVAPGENYRLKIDPAGLFSTADPHFVELGRIETPTER